MKNLGKSEIKDRYGVIYNRLNPISKAERSVVEGNLDKLKKLSSTGAYFPDYLLDLAIYFKYEEITEYLIDFSNQYLRSEYPWTPPLSRLINNTKIIHLILEYYKKRHGETIEYIAYSEMCDDYMNTSEFAQIRDYLIKHPLFDKRYPSNIYSEIENPFNQNSCMVCLDRFKTSDKVMNFDCECLSPMHIQCAVDLMKYSGTVCPKRCY